VTETPDIFAWLRHQAEHDFIWISIVAFLLFAAIETFLPDRRRRHAVLKRWIAHFGLYVLDIVCGTLMLPTVVLVLVGGDQTLQPIRLFAHIDAWGGPVAVLGIGLLSIDFLIYWAHRLQHSIPLFWRFHAVHHSDTDMDVSTALRHHPVAYLLTGMFTGVIMLNLGMPVWVFALYSLSEVPVGVFQHVATPVPNWFERSIRWVFVTPGMHQLHHSTEESYFNANFANILSIWDRLFGTFVVRDAATRERLRFGVEPYTGAEHRGALWTLTMPFLMRLGGGESVETRAAETVQHH
jgi:sterol desaturase/sphingolipid hydroxylase (fatty acid hydroxylase superfamily)